jgi:mono/diheme cytochrome c family protein
MRRLPRVPLAAGVAALAAAGVAACGEKGVSAPDQYRQGAVLFAERCSGCHSLAAAGTEGSANNVRSKLRIQGPNLDQRQENVQAVLYAIRNGGFSGAIMPQNIVTGEDAQKVAAFVARYAGRAANRPASPKRTPGSSQRDEAPTQGASSP